MHAPVWFGIQRALTDVFDGGYPADRVLQRHFKANPKLGSHDRRLFAEATYDVVRWWRRLRASIDQTSETPDVSRIVSAWCALNDVTPPLQAPAVDRDDVRARWADASLTRAVRASIPDWLDAWGEAELGPRWTDVLDRLNEPAPVYLRANRLRTTPDELVRLLAAENVAAHAVGVDGVQLEKRSNVFTSPLFKRGFFEVQDLSSQGAAIALGAKPGERVIDACAGAGGKTLHLAARMENRGRIVAMDITARKLEELRRRASRAGATCVEARVIDGTKTIKRLRDSADRVLLDVPCSGSGILRRNPDAKWRLSAEDVRRVTALQEDILARYAGMCRPGGTLVYATCSIMPSENEKQVERFVSRNETGWRLEDMATTYPSAGGPDGFFIARLTRMS
jgi:16S rRNA (cytosine967-C5)-methyltransferase